MNTSTNTITSATVNVDMILNAVTNINVSMHRDMNMSTSVKAVTNVIVLTTLTSVNANLCMFTRTQTHVLSAKSLGGGSSQAYIPARAKKRTVTSVENSCVDSTLVCLQEVSVSGESNHPSQRLTLCCCRESGQ